MKDTTVMEINLLEFDPLSITREGVKIDPKVMEKIKELHVSLSSDPGFFLFFEGNFTQVRCSFKNKRVVESWAGRYKVSLSEWKRWEEPWAHTKKYQDWYQKLFHLYTQSIFMFNQHDFNMAVDRIMHCFMNVHVANIYPRGEVFSGQMNIATREAAILSQAALEWAVIAGRLWGQASVKKEKKDEKI